MIARYPAKCFICGNQITVGKDTYDYDQKRSYHNACEEDLENQPPTADAFALADKLGYREFSWERLRSLPGESPDELQRQDHKASDTAEIGDVRGREEY